jgi:anthraniloyl-CoA monooxygenase
MRITILGAGPAGLYCGLLLKKADPRRAVTILERNPYGATYGWGVVFSDRTLAAFREADFKTYTEITDRFVLWDAIDIRFHGELMRCGGHIFAGLARKQLLAILDARCRELGVDVRYETEVADPDELRAQCDLLIAADGVNSLTRQRRADIFKPRLEAGKAKYVWYGTDKILDAFTFLFRANEHGLFQVHAYPFSGSNSTFIVECDEAAWRAAGLDEASEQGSIAYCEQLFADDLRGSHLFANYSRWINFVTVTNARWHDGNTVLLGDSAHTAHFSIGSGTKLAMEDAIALANALDQYADVERALTEYELERRPIVETLQRAARESREYFEGTWRYASMPARQFAFNLLTRSGRITYDDLRLRDPRFGDGVDRWFAAQASGAEKMAARLIAPSPLLSPLQLRACTIPNRVAVASLPGDMALDGLPGATHLAALASSALAGAGLVMTPAMAISATARITPSDVGMYRPEHAVAWRHTVSALHADTTAKVGCMLGHAGRRGSTRPRVDGLDRPLREGNWPPVSASPLPYTPRSQTPQALERSGMDEVRRQFAESARMAAEASFDLLVLHAGHGYLLASFLSPLANMRDDEYGGSLEKRMRFPLEVVRAVRASWPADRPLGVALSVTDWTADGFTVDDAIVVARALAECGCDLLVVLAGQTVPDAEPSYGRGFLTTLSDRVRNEAGITTLVGGYLTTTNEVNTALAAGRADLCQLDRLALPVDEARRWAEDRWRTFADDLDGRLVLEHGHTS